MLFSLDEHRYYLEDEIRMAAYRQAIAEIVHPDDIVLDLGSGTGILGFLACQAGAQRIYSVESSALIDLARQIARLNGMQDRITFIQGYSTNINLPEKVDVVVADQLAYFGFGAGLWECFSDARQRFLKTSGKFIPASVDLQIAPIEMASLWKQIDFWNQSPGGFDFASIGQMALNSAHCAKFHSKNLLSSPFTGASVDFDVVTVAQFSISNTFEAERDGMLHGIGGWFDACLAPGIRMSNSPLFQSAINRPNLFFPIEKPVPIQEGEQIEINLRILPADQIVVWNVAVWDKVQTEQREQTAHCKAKFSHSSWNGQLISKEDLKKRNPDYLPNLSHHGAAQAFVLELCDGKHAVKTIEQKVYQRYSEIFHSTNQVSAFVNKIINQCST